MLIFPEEHTIEQQKWGFCQVYNLQNCPNRTQHLQNIKLMIDNKVLDDYELDLMSLSALG